MKITLVNDKYIHHHGGGAQESVRILAESLAARGHEVSVWATTYQPEQKRTTEIHGGVRVTFLPVANVYWPHGWRPDYLKPLWHAVDCHNPVMAQRVGKLLDEAKPDLLHTNILAGFSPAIWAQASRRDVPVVHTQRDYYLVCPRGTKFKNGKECRTPCVSCRLYSSLKQSALCHVDAVVSISQHLAGAHQLPVPIQEVIHNSYQAESTRRPPPAAGGLRVGFLGRLFPTKGIELLLQAVQKSDSVRLYIAGQGLTGYMEHLRRIAPQRATFLGTVPPGKLFEKIDVLAVPSLWHEPFGRVAIEALAWGIPVIASRRGGLPEIIEPGLNGWLFEPTEPESLAGILRSLTPKICAAMQSACLRRALLFRPEVITGKYEELYQRVLDFRSSKTSAAKPFLKSPTKLSTSAAPS